MPWAAMGLRYPSQTSRPDRTSSRAPPCPGQGVPQRRQPYTRATSPPQHALGSYGATISQPDQSTRQNEQPGAPMPWAGGPTTSTTVYKSSQSATACPGQLWGYDIPARPVDQTERAARRPHALGRGSHNVGSYVQVWPRSCGTPKQLRRTEKLLEDIDAVVYRQSSHRRRVRTNR
jgi:hypothetical protein